MEGDQINSQEEKITVRKQLNSIYKEVEDNLLLLINNNTIDLYDIMKNYSTMFNDSINIHVYGSLSEHDNQEQEDYLTYINDNQQFSPIESFYLDETTSYMEKCFTLFSDHDRFWRNT